MTKNTQCNHSFVFSFDFLDVCEDSKHLRDAFVKKMCTNIVPLFCFFVAELGKDLRNVLAVAGYHVFCALGYVDVDVWVKGDLPLKLSLRHWLSTMIGRMGFTLSKRDNYCMLKLKLPSLLCEEIICLFIQD
jgi:hypothetical protein